MRFEFSLLPLALALTACTPPAAEPEQPAAQEADAPAAVQSSGTVVAITPEYSAVTIRHEAIPEYAMGAMTMEFTVAEGSQLAGIEVGDHVSFELSGPLDIRTIAKTESARAG